MKTRILIIMTLLSQFAFSQIITWHSDNENLPYAVYHAKIPFIGVSSIKKPLDQPNDPFFMLGNYKFLVLTHVSGIYQLFCAERAWGRLNDCDTTLNYGANAATIKINGKGYPLIGVKSMAANPETKHSFGVGFASYNYSLANNISCRRIIHVKPSKTINQGVSAMLVNIIVRNKSNKSVTISYNETATARYRMISEKDTNHISYPCTASKISGTNAVKAIFNYKSSDLLLIADKNSVSAYDGFPPSLFIAPLNTLGATCTSGFNRINEYSSDLFVDFSFTLKTNEEKTLSFIVGYDIEQNDNSVTTMKNEFTEDLKTRQLGQNSLYSKEWAAKLPDFKKESDTIMRRELVWNAYVLDALAKYSAYYNETFIPQGMTYDFNWGKHAATRDLLDAGLPLCFYNSELAKSILKLVKKKMYPNGLIEWMDYGYGAQTSSIYKPSDQQLFFFLLMAEYLKQTRDYTFLKEKTWYYPSSANNKATTLEKITQAFLYLRDEVGTGVNGMVRMLNADWNDCVFMYYPINNYRSATSHMNATLTLNALYSMIENLEAAKQNSALTIEKSAIEKLIASMKLYRDKQYDVFMKDMDKRTFPRRLYLNNEISLGDKEMYLEPVTFMLGIPDIPLATKQMVFKEVKNRLMKNEPLGAREMEVPITHEKGVRENGGVWYALNGGLMIGLSSLDRAESMNLYKKMSFNNLSKNYPNGWIGWWSAPDAINSNVSDSPGDVTKFAKPYPVFCSHAHLWTVLGYYYLYK